MRINYVLVDYENVTAVDLKNLNREDVRVIVFLGGNQLKLPAALAIQMQALGDRGEYVQICGTGPNALDFHIAFTIGEKSATESNTFFHIVSKDSGFDPLIKYLKAKKIYTVRSEAIAELPFLKVIQPKSAADRAKLVMERLSKPKSTKPRSVKTLTNFVGTAFTDQLSEKEVEGVIVALTKKGFVNLKDEKVSYQDEAASNTNGVVATTKKKS